MVCDCHVNAEGNTGNRAIGEFVAQLILDAAAGLTHRLNNTSDDDIDLLSPLLPPMLSQNYETTQDHCYNGKALREIVMSHVGVV